jgi:hypothetical protein
MQSTPEVNHLSLLVSHALAMSLSLFLSAVRQSQRSPSGSTSLELTETIFVKQGATDLSLTIPNFFEIKEYLERTEPCLVGHLLKFNPEDYCLTGCER